MRLLALFGLFVAVTCQAANLDPLVTRAELWQLSAPEFTSSFVAEYREELEDKPFRWTSEARDSARAAQPGMTLFGLPLAEAVVRFQEGKVAQLTAVIFARGDVGDLPKEKYEALVRASVAALDQATRVKLTVRGKDATNAVKADGLIWSTAAGQYLLEYSATREVKSRDVAFRAEFVRLEITPPAQKAGLLAPAPGGARARFRGPDHVDRRSPDGDVVIADVPMVDQGQKGYCAVACAERVMRYYGVPVGANELAQIANTETDGGTNPLAMLQAVKRLGARLKVRVRLVEAMEVKDILEMMAEYNRAAKKANKPEIPDSGRRLSLNAIYAAMDVDVLRATKTKNKAAVSRFQRDVQAHVDTGIPMLWSVHLGLVPEPGVPQTGGGHMRLIIGYNAKAQEILYTDSWGAGHEQKRMPLADAFTITVNLATIEPL